MAAGGKSIKAAVVVLVMACCSAGASAVPDPGRPQPATRPATQPATQPAGWFVMSPDEFAQTPAANLPLPWGDLDDRLLSAAILHETNRHRAENKLGPLRHMPRLDEAALMHSADMAAGGWFSHTHPEDPKKREVIDRVKLLGLNPRFVAENIIVEHGIRYESGRKVFEITHEGEPALSYSPDGEPVPRHTYLSFARRVVQRWMDSPGHRQNIVSPHARFLGSAARPGQSEDEVRFQKYYCTQVFFAPMPRRGD
jgi:uncharacterized protein YkwD